MKYLLIIICVLCFSSCELHQKAYDTFHGTKKDSVAVDSTGLQKDSIK